MSASYVVFSTPHSRWIIARSHALDDAFAEDAVGANHQREDHQDVGREILGAAADQRVDVHRRDVLADAACSSRAPRRTPPMIAPGIESRPPRMTTGNTLKPTSARFTSTPSRLPQRMPPSADTMPVMAHATPKYRSTSMPIAIATCWLSATARIAMPLRDFKKNQPNPARNARLTAAPSSWIGGMKSGPSMNGSSRIGSGSGLVPEKIVNGPTPRRVDATPTVGLTTPITSA